MPLNLFIIGPSGSGKSTQAKLIADKFSLTHFSLIGLIQHEIDINSGFGLEAKTYIERESLVPDSLIFDIVLSKLSALDFKNFIVSGYPRTLNQSRVVEFYFRKNKLPISAVIYLDGDSSPQVEDSFKQVKEFFTQKKKLISDTSDQDLIVKINKINDQQ